MLKEDELICKFISFVWNDRICAHLAEQNVINLHKPICKDVVYITDKLVSTLLSFIQESLYRLRWMTYNNSMVNGVSRGLPNTPPQ